MSFVLVRNGGEKINLNKAFAQSLADDLKNISEGTILLTATEISLDPNYVFKYNKPNDVEFPRRYDLVLASNSFNSNGGSIDLTGLPAGGTPNKPDPGAKGEQSHGEPAKKFLTPV